MSILKIRDAEGNVQEILAIKGSDGKDGVDGKDGYTPIKGVDYFDGKDGSDYVLTDADKQDIANIVMAQMVTPTSTDYLTEEQVLALIQANMPASAEGVDY